MPSIKINITDSVITLETKDADYVFLARALGDVISQFIGKADIAALRSTLDTSGKYPLAALRSDVDIDATIKVNMLEDVIDLMYHQAFASLLTRILLQNCPDVPMEQVTAEFSDYLHKHVQGSCDSDDMDYHNEQMNALIKFLELKNYGDN